METLSQVEIETLQRENAAIKAALSEYHKALDERQHGGIAASRFVDTVQEALGMPWKQKP